MLQIFISCQAIFRFSIKRLSSLLRFGILQWEPNPAWVQRALQFMRPDVTAHCPFFRTHDTFADRRIYTDEQMKIWHALLQMRHKAYLTQSKWGRKAYIHLFDSLNWMKQAFLCLLSSRCKIWEENSPDKETERGRNLFLLGLYCIRVTVLDFHNTVRVVKWFMIMIISQCVKQNTAIS